jgi:hypothetical protein
VIDMLKTVLLVLAGLTAGFAIAFWLQPGSAPATVETEAAPREPTPVARGASDGGASAARLAALEAALEVEVEQRAALEARVAELAAELDSFGEQSGRPPRFEQAANGGPNPDAAERIRARRDAEASPEERQRRAIERLVAAGFAPDRADWLNRRMQELRMQTLQAQYEARREGRPEPPNLDEGAALRTELGDADYERYLTAMGRSTTVAVTGVLASSPAERSGLQAGDEIVAYNGQRVFDVAELNELTLGGATGESVVVDVRRNGQTLQLVLPRGPLGIWGPFRGAPIRVER